MKSMERLKDMLCDELEELAKKGELSSGGIELAHILTDTIKNIDKIEMYEQYNESDDFSFDGGSSYRRGRGRNAKRDSMGRYSSEGGYSENGAYYERGGQNGRGRTSYRHDDMTSYDDGKQYMIEQIEELMADADTKSREALKRAVKQIENA